MNEATILTHGDLYDTNQAAWFSMKEEMARTLSIEALWMTRVDCNDAARKMPQRYGRYIDEACICASELLRRGENPNDMPPYAVRMWERAMV